MIVLATMTEEESKFRVLVIGLIRQPIRKLGNRIDEQMSLSSNCHAVLTSRHCPMPPAIGSAHVRQKHGQVTIVTICLEGLADVAAFYWLTSMVENNP
jgi:hypothetical protein